MKIPDEELQNIEKDLPLDIVKKQQEYIDRGKVKFECTGGFKKEIATKDDVTFTVTVSL